MTDIGLTHIALPVANVDRSIAFYAAYANMTVVHQRIDAETGVPVVWLSDRIRPFVLVLLQVESREPESLEADSRQSESKSIHPVLSPIAHLGVGCASRDAMDALCAKAEQEGCLLQAPQDAGYPIGYWAFLRDPDGHTLELSYGQEIGLAVQSESEG